MHLLLFFLNKTECSSMELRVLQHKKETHVAVNEKFKSQR